MDGLSVFLQESNPAKPFWLIYVSLHRCLQAETSVCYWGLHYYHNSVPSFRFLLLYSSIDRFCNELPNGLSPLGWRGTGTDSSYEHDSTRENPTRFVRQVVCL